ncbi:hypothetical protein [Modestobacter roseus]|uniref:Uncharacterized protein n=1 Tax=Modestobacter roseus TaxID=1181884 RepID=A0A562IW76_9ACTN|nr:hypothetical protein [Modestobacter roseus]MQA33393.1 hypothetical protein [Modestobacter roseus]TWH75311.1 hypothetical protein JD78_03867 [Modestobacter roseus]
MIVEVITGADEVPEVRVADVEDLGRLHLALGALTDADGDRALRAAGLGRLEDGTGFLDVAALRAAAEREARSPDWGGRFDAMVTSAADAGWAADDGASLRAHVEPAASA